MKNAHLVLVRRAVQALTFFLFLYLVLHTARGAGLAFSANALARMDPLAALTATIAGRRWLVGFLPALLLLGSALALGRFWCGWLCPLGTLLDWTSPRRGRAADLPPRWRSIKYGLLFVTLLSALWGSLTLLVLDPLALFVRSVATTVLPGLTWLVTRAEVGLYRIAFLREALSRADSALRGTVLTDQQGYYGGALLIAALLVGIVALNRIAPRAWCRYLCPLGALYGLVSKASWLKRKVSARCTHCNACVQSCAIGAIDAERGHASDSGECVLCLECAAACPQGAITYGGAWRLDVGWPHDPSRRQVLGALGISLGGLALARTSSGAHHPNPSRLRPPGVDERTLLATCVRCGACLRVCPTGGLQPSLTESGLEGFWTPVLVPRLGHCEYSCTACGEVCPTGAIPRLPQPEKLLAPIGKAVIDPAICIPWSGRGDCIVCEEMCPLPEKAILLEERTLVEGDAQRTLQAPVVQPGRCIGCGLCESKCPAQGEAAIRVRVDPMGV